MNLSQEISKWIYNYGISIPVNSLVVGVSGGIDSAVVSTLCAMTGLKTIVVSMPIHQDMIQFNLAQEHMNWLKSNYDNVEPITKDLTILFDNFKTLFGTTEHKLGLANSRSRLRMVTLYQIASINNGIVVGTGNKIEDFGIGFFTKYGDGGVDISPIADLTKTEVRKLAKELNILDDIISAKPTDGLWDDGRTDEDQIGASYEELEWVMSYSGKTNNLTQRQKKVFEIFEKFNKQNKHKMTPIPVFKK
jgi:NAD+ synthase